MQEDKLTPKVQDHLYVMIQFSFISVCVPKFTIQVLGYESNFYYYMSCRCPNGVMTTK